MFCGCRAKAEKHDWGKFCRPLWGANAVVFIPIYDSNVLRHIRIQYVTLVLIIANCVVWLGFGTSFFLSDTAVQATVFSFGFIPVVATGIETLPPQLAVIPAWATYFSYAFLHGDFMHLAGNMLFIWVFGDNVEDAMGHLRYLAFFLLCAAAGAFAHGFVLPTSEAPLIGASGAAAGIITAYLMLHPNVKVWVLALGRIPIRLSAFWIIGAWILFQIGNLAWSSADPVSWAAHVGGIAAGAILLPLLKRSNVPFFDNKPVDEVVPPVPPPAVAEPGYPLPGQPRVELPETPAEPSPWGRQGRKPQ